MTKIKRRTILEKKAHKLFFHFQHVMVEPRADNIENFATEIIDKVTLGAMDIVDTGCENTGKNLLPLVTLTNVSKFFGPNFPRAAALGLSTNCASPGCGKCNEPKNRNRSLRSARRSNERIKKNCSCDAEESENFRHLEMNLSNDVNQRASEEIRKIVEGLQGVQIGDSALVKPVKSVSDLERQIKRVVTEIGSESCDISENNISITEGHGDVEVPMLRETIAASVVEVEYDQAEMGLGKIEKLGSEVEKQNGEMEMNLVRRVGERVDPEMSRLRSTCFLHRIIRELEDAEANRENVLAGGSPASISAISQERLAAWEESEEKFIRTIEGSREENPIIIEDSLKIYPLNDAPIERIVEIEIEELDSKPESPAQTPLQLATAAPLYSVSLQESSPIIETVQETTMNRGSGQGTLERSEKNNKKSIGGKIRRFFQSAFKRRKD